MTEPIHIQLLNDDISRALINGMTYVVGSGVPGDIVEFGTMSGRTASVLAQAMHTVQGYWSVSESYHAIATRYLHLFDSFEGLPAPNSSIDRESSHVQANVWNEGLLKGISAAQLRQLVEQSLPADRIKVYEGFFEKTLPDIPENSKFALVHIDCDFYESTYQVLDHLMSHHMLSDGVLILFDDWNCNQASPDFGERKAWAEMVSKYQINYSDLGTYSAFGHRFIIHSIK